MLTSLQDTLLPSKPSDDVLLEKDFYVRMKELEAQLETLNIQEEYIKDEQKNLKRELLRAQEEVHVLLLWTLQRECLSLCTPGKENSVCTFSYWTIFGND